MSIFAKFAIDHNLAPPSVTSAANGDEQELLCSFDGIKRYAYRQTWNPDGQYVLWVMLNPGTGEIEQRRRNTLERCILWSKQWGYGGLFIGNLFPERIKSARELVQLLLRDDPINDAAINYLKSQAVETIVAWGSKGARRDRKAGVFRLLEGSKCLDHTAKGEPRHPLYVPAASERILWRPSPAALKVTLQSNDSNH